MKLERGGPPPPRVRLLRHSNDEIPVTRRRLVDKGCAHIIECGADEFKRLAAKCAELVRTKNTGTLPYELYVNSDNTVLSLSCTATRKPSWIITRIWATQWPRFFVHALHLEKYVERVALN